MKDNTSLGRYELEIEGHIVFANYQLRDGVVVINHVEAPVALRGKGAAGELMRQVMEKLKADDAKVIPLCGYAAAWIARHPEYKSMVA